MSSVSDGVTVLCHRANRGLDSLQPGSRAGPRRRPRRGAIRPGGVDNGRTHGLRAASESGSTSVVPSWIAVATKEVFTRSCFVIGLAMVQSPDEAIAAAEGPHRGRGGDAETHTRSHSHSTHMGMPTATPIRSTR